MDVGEQLQIFQNFFEKFYYENLISAFQRGENYIVVDFQDLAVFNPELAQKVLDSPEECFKTASLSIERLDLHEDKKEKEFFVRFKNIPLSQKVSIRNIRSKHIGKLIQVDGVIRQKGDVRPKAISAKFECPSCGNIMNIIQIDEKFREPSQCGCGRKGGFKLLDKLLIDIQKIVLEEPTENLDGGEQAKRFKILLQHDLVSPIGEKKTNPGSQVRLVGVVSEIPISLSSGGKSVEFDLILDGNHVEPLQEDFGAVIITPEEEEKIIQLSQKPTLIKDLVTNLAPSIYGYEKIKEALLLQQFGGIRKPRSDGIKTRGDIHILLVGDPGAAKSQLLKRMSVIAPKSRFVSGKGASGAGLTAAVIKDDFLKGWALEAGALVLANNGCVCIDELDKMTPEDRSAMHEALEQQTVTISKANIQATLRCQTTVLAAANPKYGRFDPYEILGKQIDLPPALMSRFDLMFPVRDVPDREKDTQIAKFILNLHQDSTRTERTVEIDTNLLKKYIAYAKKNVFPKLTNEALEEIEKYYVKIRNSGGDSGGIKSVPITARQLEALIRLTEACAKVRLSQIANREDAKRAINLLHYSLGQIMLDPETGRLDIDRITTGITASQRSHIAIVKEALINLENITMKKILPVADVIKECESKGMELSKIEETIEKLSRSGDIYKPKKDFISRL
ncbi:MAG: minichromosome maintenance protein MCM [Candidatus Nanoarchaeia archaeon]|nr:minichromosome maintenance protein MCM [Candidatus Nanoarchaeia archaeon]